MPKKLWDVFISYKSGPDQAPSFALAEALEARQIRCWIAPRDVASTISEMVARGILARPGYDDAIPYALEHSGAMVVMVSAAAMQSDHVKDEINLAKDFGLGFFPVRIENVPLQNSFRYHLGRAQWNDCFAGSATLDFGQVTTDIEGYLASRERSVTAVETSNAGEAAPPVTVRMSLHALSVGGFPVSLQPEIFQVLLALAQRRNRPVERDELLELVYPGVVDDNGVVAEAVGALRQLLGQSAIVTIPGRGYQFALALDPASTVGEPFDLPSGTLVMATRGVTASTAIAPAATTAPTTLAADEPANAESAGGNAFSLQANLPEKLPAMFGREADLASLAELISQHPLVTIVGAGGLGKSCLAQHLLEAQRNHFRDGVSYISLAALRDPVLLAGVIANSAGLQTGGGEPLLNLVAGLKPMRAILVLDNAEHLVDEVARVVDAILSGTRHVRLVVTSQRPLKQAQERVYRLGTLAVPAHDTDLQAAAAFGAVALFVERAQAADRRFALTAKNVVTVISICRRLDGMALAIALAAARVPLLGVEKLAGALDNRLRLLTGGNRGAPERHQTLRAALEWSHGLLSTEEQIVFSRLGIFAGGFTLELAQQVVADEIDATGAPQGVSPLDEWAVVEVLGALVDRSLVMTDTWDPPRYFLQESPRAFALERLDPTTEKPALRARHARAMLECFARADTACWHGDIGVDEMVATLEDELDNAREALQWMIAHAPQMAVAMASPLSSALTVDRSQERDLLWTATAAIVERIDAEVPAPTDGGNWPALRAAWALGCARSWGMRNIALSVERAREAATFYQNAGAAHAIDYYLALAQLCCAAGAAAPTPEAEAALLSLKALEQYGWSARVKCWGGRAASYVEMGREAFTAAQRAFQRSLNLAEEAGDANGVNASLSNLVNVALANGAVLDAVNHGTVLEQRLHGTRHQRVLASTRLNLCAAQLSCDAVTDAERTARLGWPAAVQFKFAYVYADNLALLAVLQGRAHDAALLCGYGDAGYRNAGVVRETNEACIRGRAEQLARAIWSPTGGGDTAFDDARLEGETLGEATVATIAFSAPGE